MILFFPVMYPDELFFSVVSRFFERIGNLENTSFDGFNFRNFLKHKFLLNDFEEFLSHIPPEDNLNPIEILYNHSIFPIWALFVSSKKKCEFLIKTWEPGGTHLMFSTKSIKFCPECFKEDVEKYTEPYWHCNHNILGVTICSKHRVFLEIIEFKENAQIPQSFTAKSLKLLPPSRPIDLENDEHRMLERISNELQWIWDNRHKLMEADFDLKLLYSSWIEIYLSTNISPLRSISTSIERFYSKELLEKLNCSIDHDSQNPWIRRLFYTNHEITTPINNILIIIFLAGSVNNFFMRQTYSPPFGSGPWPCFNPACENYYKNVIQSVELIKKPRVYSFYGVFKCVCGFSYQLDSIYFTNINEFTYLKNHIKIVNHGRVWKDRLRGLWVSNHRVEEIRIILQTSRDVIKHYADELSLQPRIKTALLAKAHNGESLDENLFLQICNNRKKNIEIQIEDLSHIEHPDILVVLQKQDDFLWLCVYDYLGVSRLLRNYKIDVRKIDWNLVDLFLARKINATITEMIISEFFPVRLTIDSIECHLGFTRIQQHNLSKVPISFSILKNFTETRHEFNVRKIRWGFNFFLSKNTYPSKAYFKKICRIYNCDEEITSLIDKSLADLASFQAEKIKNPDKSTT